jgi:hypothetical protein
VLPAVDDRLPEHPVLVAQPVAHRGELHRRHRVEEARGKPPEPAVAQAGVGLALEQVRPVVAIGFDRRANHRIEQQVVDVVRERAADQELHRQVVDPLRIAMEVRFVGGEPALRQHVAGGAGERLETLAGAGLARSSTLSNVRCRSKSELSEPEKAAGAMPYWPTISDSPVRAGSMADGALAARGGFIAEALAVEKGGSPCY